MAGLWTGVSVSDSESSIPPNGGVPPNWHIVATPFYEAHKLRILDDGWFWYAHIPPGLPNPFLELFSFPTSVLVKLLEVLDALLWGTELRFLPLLSLSNKFVHESSVRNSWSSTYIPQKLLSSDLYWDRNALDNNRNSDLSFGTVPGRPLGRGS